MPTTTTRIESFPFDSKFNGYDDYGYPVYDRAVGATMLRETFKNFFTDGVFATPASGLQIGKASSGLAVTIQPGVFIINGSMGAVLDEMSLVLDSAPPQGRIPYAIMLRFDNTENARSLYVTVEKGIASSTPVPPEPDQSTPAVMEYRLGWVDVPSGATDLSGATVTNEKGTDVCPFASAYMAIDMDYITNDAKAQADATMAWFDANMHAEEARANQRVDELEQEVRENLTLLETAIDGTTAGHLQNQIDQIDAPGILSDVDIDEIWGETYMPVA